VWRSVPICIHFAALALVSYSRYLLCTDQKSNSSGM
jgi:hypothetical protein